MPNILFLVFSMFIFIPFFSLSAENNIDSLLIQLEETMSKREYYDLKKQNKIEGLKSLLHEKNLSPERTFYINNKILEEYIPYNFDSAMHYIDLNLKLSEQQNNIVFKNKTNIQLAIILSFSGCYLEAIDVTQLINYNFLSKESKKDLLNIYVKIYSELSLFTSVKANKSKYEKLHQVYTDSLIQKIVPESELYLSLKEKKFRDNRQLVNCKRINTQRLSLANMGSRNYSTIAFERAILYELENNIELEKKYLILSSISDIKASVKDNASLAKLAMLLYEEGNIDDAYKYIMFAFEDAAFYNSRLRFIQISEILPLISEAYQIKTDHQKSELRKFLFIISTLSVILLLAFIAIFNQVKSIRKAHKKIQENNSKLKVLNENLSYANSKLNKLNIDLQESDKVKEHYIGNFLAICSEYVDKLDDFRKMVNKYIAGRKIEELYTKTKSGKLIEQEIQEFYNNFDNTFLHIFPNFVEELNDLLVKEEQIIPKNEEILSTELRIFALIRLGIHDSSKIAHLLRYSVNTIYNYRVKIKNKAAVPRDEFEDYVMKTGTKYE